MSKKGKEASSFYLPPNVARMSIEYKEGAKTGESCRIQDLESVFCWMKTFLNCFTGYANSGKSTYVLFLMLVKSVVDGWRWGIWSPEMIVSVKTDKGMQRVASPIYNMLIHSYTGKSPYKHHKNQIELEDYMKALQFIEDHFYVIDTVKDKLPNTVIGGFKMLHDVYGIDGWLVDPFKNLTIDESKGTKDRVLEAVFDEFEELALMTNTVGNFIAHPRSMDETQRRKKGKEDGPFKVVVPGMLLGGSVWENSMDGIFTYDRQELHLDINSPLGRHITYKQRMQELTTKRGRYENIYFDSDTARFYFDNVCPIDGSKRIGTQGSIFDKQSQPRKKKDEPPLPTEAPF